MARCRTNCVWLGTTLLLAACGAEERAAQGGVTFVPPATTTATAAPAPAAVPAADAPHAAPALPATTGATAQPVAAPVATPPAAAASSAAASPAAPASAGPAAPVASTGAAGGGAVTPVPSGFDAGSGELQPDGKTVIYRIPDGTGGNDWNPMDKPIRVKRGWTLHLIDEDGSTSAGGHWLHTNGQPCSHGRQAIGEGFDCPIGMRAPIGIVSGTFEHNVANGIGRIYIEVVADAQ